MKCNGCGHEFVKTLSRCPRCHRSTSNSASNSTRRGRASTDSRLLEFPRKTRYAAPVEAPVSVPAWRAELTEKVRAIRARRSADPQACAPGEQVGGFESDNRTNVVVEQLPEPAISYSPNITPRRAVARTSAIEQAETPVVSPRRTSSNIVEAALIRVKRASENASRAALPKIEPARNMQATTQVGLALDRGATARALEPAPEVESRPEPAPAPSPRPELVQSQARLSPRVETQSPRLEPSPRIERPSLHIETASPLIETASPQIATPSPRIETTPLVESKLPEKESATSYAVSAMPDTSASEVAASILPLDEIEPVDYLEAEIRKVDQAYGAAFLRNESPSILIHAVIFGVDALSLIAACAPFLAIISIADGSFASTQTKITACAVVAVISFFYLLLTQGLCGRTFGMMLTNTRIVDAGTFEAPAATRALARTAGYFIAIAPIMLGVVWAAFNKRRRGWQDYISGTIVVRDF